LQAEDFADAKSRALRHHDHRAVRLREMLEHFEELSHRRGSVASSAACLHP
jgi:hypothetical protein